MNESVFERKEHKLSERTKINSYSTYHYAHLLAILRHIPA
jgi:hypothetical protein